MNKKIKILESLVTVDAKETREWIKEHSENRKFYRNSQKIALHIRKRLDELGWKQKDLAEQMGVTAQQINKWVSGKENFRLDTLIKLEEVLKTDLIEIKSFEPKIEFKKPVIESPVYPKVKKVKSN